MLCDTDIDHVLSNFPSFENFDHLTSPGWVSDRLAVASVHYASSLQDRRCWVRLWDRTRLAWLLNLFSSPPTCLKLISQKMIWMESRRRLELLIQETKKKMRMTMQTFLHLDRLVLLGRDALDALVGWGRHFSGDLTDCPRTMSEPSV